MASALRHTSVQPMRFVDVGSDTFDEERRDEQEHAPLTEWIGRAFVVIDAVSLGELTPEEDMFLYKHPACCSLEMHSTFTHVYQLLRLGEIPELRAQTNGDDEQQFEGGVEMLTEWPTHKALLFKPPLDTSSRHMRDFRDQLWLLTAPVSTGDSVLRMQMRLLWQAFAFFHGSLDALLAHCVRAHEAALARPSTPSAGRKPASLFRAESLPTVAARASPFALALAVDEPEQQLDYNKPLRQHAKQALAAGMRDLLPLLESFHAAAACPEVDAARTFRPLLPTRLPVSCRRLIVTASQLLASIVRMSSRIDSAAAAASPRTTQNPAWNLGAALFFDHSVLASQFDPQLTRWILYAAALRRSHPELAARDEHADTAAAATSSTAAELLMNAPRRAFQPSPVRATDRFSSAADDQQVEIEYIRVYLDARRLDTMRQQRALNARSCVDAEPPAAASSRLCMGDGEFVGVYLMYLSHLTLAVLLELPALYNQRHTSLLRLTAETPLGQLQDSLLRAQQCQSATPALRATGRSSSRPDGALSSSPSSSSSSSSPSSLSSPSSSSSSSSSVAAAPINAYADSSPSVRRALHQQQQRLARSGSGAVGGRRHSVVYDPVVLSFLCQELRLTCDLFDARTLELALVGAVPPETSARPAASNVVRSLSDAHALFDDADVDLVILGDHTGYTYAHLGEGRELHVWKPLRDDDDHFASLECLEADARAAALL